MEGLQYGVGNAQVAEVVQDAAASAAASMSVSASAAVGKSRIAQHTAMVRASQSRTDAFIMVSSPSSESRV
jgi:hypothetical protein